MSGNNINFEEKKIKTSGFHKNKKIDSIDDIDGNKISVSKKESYGIKNLNTLLDIMIMMLLDHYV